MNLNLSCVNPPAGHLHVCEPKETYDAGHHSLPDSIANLNGIQIALHTQAERRPVTHIFIVISHEC